MSISNQDAIMMIAAVLEVEPQALTLETKLAELEQWDSMAMISFISAADAQYKVKIAAQKLNHCITVQDLVGLLSS